MKFVYNDGGRKKAGFKGYTNDCVVRAVSIAMERPYKEVYNEINEFASKSERRKNKSSSRTGVYPATIKRYMFSKNWKWKATMFVGSGCQVHLKNDEIPMNCNLVVCLSRHVCAVINGTIHDISDPSRNGTRCVYGYYYKR